MLNPNLSVVEAAALGIAKTKPLEGRLLDTDFEGNDCADYLGAVLLGFGIPFEAANKDSESVHHMIFSEAYEASHEARAEVEHKVNHAGYRYAEIYGCRVIHDNDVKGISREMINFRMAVATLDQI